MTVTWYPRNIATGAFLFAVFALAINVAVDVNRGTAMGIAAALSYLCIDVLLSFNPAVWQQRDRTAPPQA